MPAAMMSVTPTQLRALRVADTCGDGLGRVSGGYGAWWGGEVFTVRTINALERDGMLEFVGMFNTQARITRAGKRELEAAP